MKVYRADLHIHTCLSPCADLDMTPRAIVAQSIAAGVDIIAVCDHNSAENVAATMRAASAKDLLVLPGMEVCSKEEVHFLALFERPEKVYRLQDLVQRHLTGTNRPELFGDQVIVNEFDEVDGFSDRLLIGAVDLSLKEIALEVQRLDGLGVAAHVDRPSFSVSSQLGFIPSDLRLDALEFARKPDQGATLGGEGLPILMSSDAHFLNDIGRVHTSFWIGFPSFHEIRLALLGEAGRRVAS
jgi:PHP family Zn ribbon phosphoesterase